LPNPGFCPKTKTLKLDGKQVATNFCTAPNDHTRNEGIAMNILQIEREFKHDSEKASEQSNAPLLTLTTVQPSHADVSTQEARVKTYDDARQNYLLASLPDDEFARLAPNLERVGFERSDIVYSFGEKLHYVYFPTTATASLLCIMDDGTSVEVAGVGNEGILGASIFFGSDTSLTQATILNSGFGYRLSTKCLKQEFERNGALQYRLMRYTQTLIGQMAQTTGCTRRHSVEQQLCRWLLLNLDRSPSDNLLMTQELIAGMLGVRRESITEAARKLQLAGYINYSRGHIEVLDRTGLESQACACYEVMKQSFGSLRSDLLASWAASNTYAQGKRSGAGKSSVSR